MKKNSVRFVVSSFPEGTKEIFICGNCKELGNWDASKAIQMQYYQNDGTPEEFFTEIQINGQEEIQYKYLNHPSWDNVECGFVALDVENHSLTVKNEFNSREVNDSVKGFRI